MKKIEEQKIKFINMTIETLIECGAQQDLIYEYESGLNHGWNEAIVTLTPAVKTLRDALKRIEADSSCLNSCEAASEALARFYLATEVDNG